MTLTRPLPSILPLHYPFTFATRHIAEQRNKLRALDFPIGSSFPEFRHRIPAFRNPLETCSNWELLFPDRLSRLMAESAAPIRMN